jgi:shikimate dehydrogenase
MIKGTTKLLGVIGDPVEHSLSPVMHNAAIAYLKADYIYLPFPIKPENLSTAIAGLEAIAVQGFSITIPHKQTIIPLLQEITPEAKMIGAVNTVWHTDQGWQGTNTDYLGFIAPLKELDQDWQKMTPIILGNGGAARAVIVGLHSLGCPEIHVFGRNQDKLVHFAQSWHNTPLEKVLKVHSWDNLKGMVSQSRLIVNTTPVGMYPQINNCPLEDDIMSKIQPKTMVYDLIYTPKPTLFLKKAQAQGAIIIDGLEMLVQQGAKALEIWLNQDAPVNIMREALLQQLSLS